MWTATKNTKCCATCANWGGARTATSAKNAETSSPSERGKCFAGEFSGVIQGHTAMQGTSCSNYELWSAIR